MRIVLLIGVGSFIGGMARFVIFQLIQNRTTGSFPYGTLSVNIIGCFLIGIIFGLTERSGLSNEWRLFLTTGILGGFTTFSAFSHESIALIRDGQAGIAMLYIGLSVVVGLVATWLGILTTA